MQVRDCMKQNVVSISISATIGQAASRLASRHIGMLPVVDQTGKMVGVLELQDLLALILPDFVQLLEDFDFVHDFGAVETQLPSPDMLAKPIREVMNPPISVQERSGLLLTFALLRKHNLHDMPVVDENGRLVGIASRVDIGRALLSSWHTSEKARK